MFIPQTKFYGEEEMENSFYNIIIESEKGISVLITDHLIQI